jgi:hypothetical protein
MIKRANNDPMLDRVNITSISVHLDAVFRTVAAVAA